MTTTTVQPLEWISFSGTNRLATMINLKILKHEIKSRKITDSKFTTNLVSIGDVIIFHMACNNINILHIENKII